MAKTDVVSHYGPVRTSLRKRPRSWRRGLKILKTSSSLEDPNCDEVQGYLISRPLKLESFSSFVANFGNAKSIV